MIDINELRSTSPSAQQENDMIDTKEQSKKYAVCWENDCGYGTDYFATPEERDAEIAAIRRTGTDAWPVDLD